VSFCVFNSAIVLSISESLIRRPGLKENIHLFVAHHTPVRTAVRRGLQSKINTVF
jgi:hypothetical protein